jgi:hypothetical protein
LSDLQVTLDDVLALQADMVAQATG